MWDLIVSVPDHCLSFYFDGFDDFITHVILDEFITHAMRTYYRCEKFVRVLHRSCHAVIYLFIDRSESRTRYFRDGKLIIGAAKLIDLDNYIKVFRGYFTKYIHASTPFFSTRTF